MKFRLNRPLVSVVTTVALLLALVAGVALLRGRAPSAVPAAPASNVAASQGDYRLSRPNEAEPATGAGETSPAANAPGFTDFREDRSADAPAASAPVAYCAAVYQVNDELYQACVASAEPGQVEDRPGAYLPGEEDPGTACRQLAGCDR